MKINKKKIIVGIVVIVAFAVSFLHGGNIYKSTQTEPIFTENKVHNPKTDEVHIENFEAEERKDENQKLSADDKEDFIPDTDIENLVTLERGESNPSDLLICTLSVRCDAVLDNLEMLSYGKQDIIPRDGAIFKEQAVEFYEGESVFDVLFRQMRDNNIHLEFVNTPIYNSVYIEGIGNLYEFDCGDYSGWLYAVNGIQPTYGCSQYQVKNGDEIQFFYNCNIFEQR